MAVLLTRRIVGLHLAFHISQEARCIGLPRHGRMQALALTGGSLPRASQRA